MLELKARGAVTFDYGNNLRAQAEKAGEKPAPSRSRGSSRATSGPSSARGRVRSAGPRSRATRPTSPRPTRPSSELFPENAALARWIRLARERVAFQGLPARICWLGYGERAKAGLAFNELVRSGRVKAPIVIGRDHLDAGSVASPNRETEAMRDGSDAIADWPLLNALVNTAAGATWVSHPPRRRRRHRLLDPRRHGRRGGRDRRGRTAAPAGPDDRPGDGRPPARRRGLPGSDRVRREDGPQGPDAALTASVSPRRTALAVLAAAAVAAALAARFAPVSEAAREARGRRFVAAAAGRLEADMQTARPRLGSAAGLARLHEHRRRGRRRGPAGAALLDPRVGPSAGARVGRRLRRRGGPRRRLGRRRGRAAGGARRGNRRGGRLVPRHPLHARVGQSSRRSPATGRGCSSSRAAIRPGSSGRTWSTSSLFPAGLPPFGSGPARRRLRADSLHSSRKGLPSGRSTRTWRGRAPGSRPPLLRLRFWRSPLSRGVPRPRSSRRDLRSCPEPRRRIRESGAASIPARGWISGSSPRRPTRS